MCVSTQLAFYVGTNGGTQVLKVARQAFYQLSHFPTPMKNILGQSSAVGKKTKKGEGTESRFPGVEKKPHECPGDVQHTCPSHQGATRVIAKGLRNGGAQSPLQ